jgi:hypothetical protein
MNRKVVALLIGFVVAALITTVLSSRLPAGIRGPGKYSGVVIFDRWDTCFLLSGPYITYVSEKVKEELRQYQSLAMEVDASDVFQPINPGDALIRRYEILGPAPEPAFLSLKGLELRATTELNTDQQPIFFIEIRNAGYEPVPIVASEIGPVVTSNQYGFLRSPFSFSPSDGASAAVVTRTDLSRDSWSAEETAGIITRRWAYRLDRAQTNMELQPGQSLKVHLTMTMPPGQYEFMFGYGGGVHEERSLASNSIWFDVDENGTQIIR